jgi:hypothetical protein
MLYNTLPPPPDIHETNYRTESIAEDRRIFRPMRVSGDADQGGAMDDFVSIDPTPCTAKSAASDQTVKEIKGVISRINDDLVEVRLPGDIVAEFPRFLFQDSQILKYGQSVLYQVKESRDGMRYQSFVAGKNIDSMIEEKMAIIEKLDNMRL